MKEEELMIDREEKRDEERRRKKGDGRKEGDGEGMGGRKGDEKGGRVREGVALICELRVFFILNVPRLYVAVIFY